MSKGTSTTSWQAQTFQLLNREHRKHQATKPGNTDPDCPVCKFNNGTLYADEKKED
jgi:hypothetical protein